MLNIIAIIIIIINKYCNKYFDCMQVFKSYFIKLNHKTIFKQIYFDFLMF